MARRFNLTVGLGVVLSVAACDTLAGPAQIAGPSGDPSLALRVQSADRSLRVIAQAVAVAMEQKDVRLAVRDAMRDSPWDVHQISLQDFVAGPQGASLLRAAATATGDSPDTFRSRLRDLPDLDFYVPSRAQRLSWRGGAGVVVVAGINMEDGAVYAFDGAGQSVPDVRHARAENRPMMLLTAAEPRGRRNRPQPVGVGDVIQSASDGEEAVRYTWTDAAGRTTVVDPATAAGERPSISMSTSTYGDSTYLDDVYFNADDAGEDMEVTFYARFYRPDGTLLGEWTYQNYSFPYQQHWRQHQPLLPPVLPDSSAAYIELRIREDDGGFLNPDEWYGPRKYTWVDRGELRRIDEENSTTVYVDVELGWVQRAPSTVTSVSVAGTSVDAGSTASTYATAYDQYGWAMPGQSVSAWWTDNSSVATATGSGGTSASIAGISTGSTSARATIAGITGSGAVTVEDPYASCDPSLDPLCPA